MVPGFEGIFHTKYLRRIKIVDRYYMNYNDYGHLHEGEKEKEAALSYQIGPKSVTAGPHPQKKRYTPTNNDALMSPRHDGSGRSGSRCATCASMYFSMNVA
jgi:hypothetical protein